MRNILDNVFYVQSIKIKLARLKNIWFGATVECQSEVGVTLVK